VVSAVRLDGAGVHLDLCGMCEIPRALVAKRGGSSVSVCRTLWCSITRTARLG
jgi:hypothetical protein